MSLVPLETLKAQRKVTYAVEDDLLQGYLDAADVHVQNFLNRNVYADSGTYAAAMAQATTDLAAADAAWGAATAAWRLLPAGDMADLAYEKLTADWSAAKEVYLKVAYGKVITPNISQAIVLLAAGWDANREYVITELSNAIELPMGVVALLSPDRVRQGV